VAERLIPAQNSPSSTNAKNYSQVKPGRKCVNLWIAYHLCICALTDNCFLWLKKTKKKMSCTLALPSLLKNRTRRGSKCLRVPSSRISYHDTELFSWLALSARPDGSD